LIALCSNEFTNDAEFMCDKTIVTSKHHRFQPEFAGSIFPPYVDVGWFVTVETVKEHSIWARDVSDSRHDLDQRRCSPKLEFT
jgi:hypothetical protein